MILRSITEHVKTQNWIAIWLDFFIVVFGVFIGLQVSNWNAARQDRLDEELFISRLHEDLQHGEALIARLRDVRLARASILNDATDVVFERVPRTELSELECRVIASAHYFNFAAPQLPSVVELLSSGRMTILRDAELRAALIGLQQTREALVLLINVQTQLAIDIPSEYFDLIQAEAFFHTEAQEVVQTFKCNLEKMRQNQKFLNDLSSASDRNDAFLRDGLAPWNEQFTDVHKRVDAALGVSHDEENQP